MEGDQIIGRSKALKLKKKRSYWKVREIQENDLT